MSITRLKSKTKTPRKSFFTMVELIAVISITAILLTITINIMKTDSTKANVQVVGGAIAYAQAYAMSNTTFTIVEFSDSDGDGNEDTITVKEAENSGTAMAPNITEITTSPIKKEERFVAGSAFTTSPSTLYFSPTGEPVSSSNNTAQSTTTMTIQDNRNTEITAIVRVKPFNGKVTYY